MTTEIPATFPPRFAERLLGAAAAQECDAVLGDLHEEFSTFIVPSRGCRAARWWYRRQVAQSLLPLCVRAWQRASIERATAACLTAGAVSVVPGGLLLMLRSFVLQQVPLKTTAEVSLAFAAALVAVVIVGIAVGVSIAVRFLNNDRRSAD